MDEPSRAQRSQPLTWWFLDTHVVEHRSARDGLWVLDMTLPAGAAPPEHVHHSYDDSMFVIDGELVGRVGTELFTAGPGVWVSVPRGVPHAWRVVGGPGRILAVYNQPSFVNLLHDIGTPAAASGLPPGSLSPSAPDVLGAFAAHDVTVVGVSIEAEEAAALLAAVL